MSGKDMPRLNDRLTIPPSGYIFNLTQLTACVSGIIKKCLAEGPKGTLGRTSVHYGSSQRCLVGLILA